MNYKIELCKLQFKKNKFILISAVSFIYLVLIPIQNQIQIEEISEMQKLMKLFSSIQLFLPLYFLLFLFIGLKQMLYLNLCEVIYQIYNKEKFSFALLWGGIATLFLVPYHLWNSYYYTGYLPIMCYSLYEQLFLTALFYCLTQLSCSALIGIIWVLLFNFASLIHLIPENISIIQSWYHPSSIKIDWYLSYLILILFLIISGRLLEKSIIEAQD